MYITNNKCKICGNFLNLDDIKNYGDVCFNCCSDLWARYEKAHSGECNHNVKREPISDRAKRYILSRDKKCLICGSTSDLTIDHIVPISNGGDNSITNLQCLCRKCNSIKSNYPEDYREVIEL